MRYFHQRVWEIVLITIVVGIIQNSQAKSTYPDGNYSEAGGKTRMCMRCHMAKLYGPSQGQASVSLSSSSTSTVAGGQISVVVSKSSFDMNWNPGIMLHFERNSEFAARDPFEVGWQGITSPYGGSHNFIVLKDKAVNIFTWLLKTPQRPGSYRIAVSAYFNEGTKTEATAGTVRGENSLEITVTPASEMIKPQLLKVEGKYQKYVFLTFSEPVEENDIINLNNYVITELKTGKILSVLNASLSRDAKRVILKTAPHLANTDYSILVKNIRDYAEVPNTIDPITVDYTPDLNSSYKIYAEFTQDVTATKIMQYDETEYLGRDSLGAINRINFAWVTPDDPLDLLPEISFVSAKLKIRQKNTPFTTAAFQDWEVFRLNPGSNWWEYFGNNATLIDNWSGYNQDTQPLNTLSNQISNVIGGTPAIWWEWDITSNFKIRYDNPGGSGTNAGDYFLRLKVKTESFTSGGAGFYGHDALDPNNVPFIELSLTPPDTAGNPVDLLTSKTLIQRIRIEISPNPFSSQTLITTKSDDPMQLWESSMRLSVYDLGGRRLRTLINGENKDLNRRIFWNGTDDSGVPVGEGVFLLRVEAGSFCSIQKILKID